MTLDGVTLDIRQKTGSGRPALIGIDGFEGSGKSTIAQKLATKLGDAYVIGLDEFIVKEKLTETSWDNGTFDRQRIEEQVLRPLSQGRTAQYRQLDWKTNTLSHPITIPNLDFVIIEGVTACHPDIKRYYDFTIWVDTPLEIARQRMQSRDGADENAGYWDRWIQNDLAYQRKYHPGLSTTYRVVN